MRSFHAIPTAAGGITRLAHARASEAGIDLKPLLKKAGLREQQIGDRDTRLDVRHQIRFLNLVANALPDELLGFHLAQPVDLRELGWLYYVAASSETLGEALRRTARYSSMVNEGVSVKYLEGEDIKISFDYIGIARHSDRHQIEFLTTVLIRLCRHLTGRRLVPIRARFTHHRDSEFSEFAAFYGGDVEFGATMDEVAFAMTTKHLPLVSADPYLNELLIASCEEALSRRPTNRGPFRSQVENAIVPLLPHGKARAAEIARRLGLGQRTFARRLAMEGKQRIRACIQALDGENTAGGPRATGSHAARRGLTTNRAGASHACGKTVALRRSSKVIRDTYPQRHRPRKRTIQ